MAFIQDEPKADTKVCMEMSRKLHSAVSRRRKIQYLQKDWISEFQTLLRDYDTERVQDTLNWYAENYGKEYVPLASTARYFRMKYPQIEAARQRMEIQGTTDPTAIAFADSLKIRFEWPIEVRDRLDWLVAQSSASLIKFTRAISSLNNVPESWMRFVVSVIHPNIHMLLVTWFEDVAYRLNYPYHQHYYGNINHLIFDFTSERFHASHWREWSRAWCGQSQAYDELLSRLIELSKETT